MEEQHRVSLPVGGPPRRLRVLAAWVWGALLGTLVVAPTFGLCIGIVSALVYGHWSAVPGSAAIGLWVGLVLVAVPAMVLAPMAAVLATRPTDDVESPQYSFRVRLVVATVLTVASIPLAVAFQGATHLAMRIAFWTIPVFVAGGAMTMGRIAVRYTSRTTFFATRGESTWVGSEARFVSGEIARLIALGISDEEIAARVNYETDTPTGEILRRTGEIRARSSA